MRAIYTLPLPPSTNRLWIKTKGGMALAPEYRAWKREAGWIVRAARQPKIAGRFKIEIAVPEKMRGDTDNRAKAVLDLLRGVGATDDDVNADDVRVYRSPECEHGVCHVTVSMVHAGDRGVAGGEVASLAPITPESRPLVPS